MSLIIFENEAFLGPYAQAAIGFDVIEDYFVAVLVGFERVTQPFGDLFNLSSWFSRRGVRLPADALLKLVEHSQNRSHEVIVWHSNRSLESSYLCSRKSTYHQRNWQ